MPRSWPIWRTSTKPSSRWRRTAVDLPAMAPPAWLSLSAHRTAAEAPWYPRNRARLANAPAGTGA
jgi:hypothetical protein